jgi:hypothetical protein
MDEATKFKIATQITEGAEGEAKAMKDYARELAEIYALDKAAGDEMNPIISEIIADELNHLDKLILAFSELTGIEAKQD